MSEYQYYEFQAIDRPLSRGDQESLRAMSSRARITSTSFTNEYEWGSFKGDPARLMERWFDLHLYMANWGSRRLMIRWPARLLDRHAIGPLLTEIDCATLKAAGDNLILDIARDPEDGADWVEEDGSGRLAALAPLRTDVLGGDLRLFYLLWLTAVEEDTFEDDEPEPLPGLGPMTGALEAFADFFAIDPDLVAAAAEQSSDPLGGKPPSADAARAFIAALSDKDKTAFLTRLFDGDVSVATELRVMVLRRAIAQADVRPAAKRTVGDLRARAKAIRQARASAKAAKADAERARQEAEAAKARRARLDAVARRGESVWREIESEIERRSGPGYDRAAGLLADLRAIAEEKGTTADYLGRLGAIRERHARKQQFIMRLAALK